MLFIAALSFFLSTHHKQSLYFGHGMVSKNGPVLSNVEGSDNAPHSASSDV
jgi:hypothetical protein